MPATPFEALPDDARLWVFAARTLLDTERPREIPERLQGWMPRIVSEDDGRTWRESAGYCQLPVVHTRSGLQEPGVVEL